MYKSSKIPFVCHPHFRKCVNVFGKEREKERERERDFH